MTHEKLTWMLTDFCNRHGLPHIDANELLARDMTAPAEKAWLKAFLKKWDQADVDAAESERSIAIQLAGLRLLQREFERGRISPEAMEHLQGIAEDLTVDEIDDICEAINN